MPKVFLSHDFDDKAIVESTMMLFDQNEIEYWNPKEMRGGENLAPKLRSAISESQMCVFVATRQSVDSKWCMAELGAFWGAGKTVMIYEADGGLDAENLPPQFGGSFRVTSPRKLIEDVQLELVKPQLKAPGSKAFANNGCLKGDVEEKHHSHAVTRYEDVVKLQVAMKRWDGFFSGSGNDTRLSPDIEEGVRAFLKKLIGLSSNEVDLAVVAQLPYRFNLKTSTDLWRGFAATETSHADGDIEVYTRVLLLVFGADERCVAVAAVGNVLYSRARGLTESAFRKGMVSIGELGPGIPDPEQRF